jgi:hypothetical protein
MREDSRIVSRDKLVRNLEQSTNGVILNPQNIANAARFIPPRPPLCNVVALQMRVTYMTMLSEAPREPDLTSL